MNDLYAVSPEAPQDTRDLAELFRIFQPSEGRFIAKFPLDWHERLRRTIAANSDIEYKRFIELWLCRGQQALLPIAESYRESISWEENAVKANHRFLKVIGPRNSTNPMLTPFDRAICDPEAFRDSRGDFIQQTSAAYIRASMPLLLTSLKVVLVDPYFTLLTRNYRGVIEPEVKRKNFMKDFIEAAILARRVECIEIFCDPQKQRTAPYITLAELNRELEDIAKNAGAHQLSVSHAALDASHHARYLLGLNSGIKFDHGFQLLGKKHVNHVEWISPSTLKPLLEKFT